MSQTSRWAGSVGCSQNSLTTRNGVPLGEYPQVKRGSTHSRSGEHIPSGVEEAALYPLFTPALIDLMREVIPPERQDSVAVSVITKARKPS